MSGSGIGEEMLGAYASFIEGGVSVIAASQDGSNTPVIARCLGGRVCDDGQRVRVCLSGSQSAALVDAVRSCGAIAVVFTQPSTHKTIQLKGMDGIVMPAESIDLRGAESYTVAFVEELGSLGYREEFVRALLWWDPSDLLAIVFTPSAAFMQTPGPGAGEPLRPDTAC